MKLKSLFSPLTCVWFVTMALLWAVAYFINASAHFALFMLKLFFIFDGALFLAFWVMSMLPRRWIIKENKPLSAGLLNENRTW